MNKTVTYLNEEHDIVAADQAIYVVETETDADGQVVFRSWGRVTEIDGELTEYGELIS